MREPNSSDYNDYRRATALTPYVQASSETIIEAPAAGASLDIPSILRRYWLLAGALILVGMAAGLGSVILSTPVYKARALVEVQRVNGNVLRTEGGNSNPEDGQVELQTQIHMMGSGAFLRQVMDRMQLENTPPAPLMRDDIFSRLRRRLGAASQEPAAILKQGLNSAVNSFDVRPVNGTRILEISCDSTHPEVAANFVNTVANEYIHQNMQSRMKAAQSTNEMLSQKLEETKAKMLDADSKLQDFVRASGNLFVQQENTLADTKVRDLQAQLSSVQAERIRRQGLYELVHKTPREALPEILPESGLHTYQTQIADLKRQRAALAVVVIGGPKIQNLDVQIQELQATLQRETDATIKRIDSDYDTIRATEKHLSDAYASAAGQVGGQAGKAAQYSALKRESESLRSIYNSMLLQANEAFINGSVVPNNISLVDPAIPPDVPYKPKPAVNLGFGAIVGLFICCGIAVFREKMDQRVNSPYHARQLLNLPQLGVIPSADEDRKPWRFLPVGKSTPGDRGTEDLAGDQEGSDKVLDLSPTARPLLAESFRVTLASLMRETMGALRPKVILVTSAGPEEGKTTIASNLGMALAETGRKVLVLDADFRRPKAHKVFGIRNTWGLVDLLAESKPVDDYAADVFGIRTTIPHLFVLPNGKRSENIAKALYSVRLRQLMQRMRNEFDTILIDAPPLLNVADARVMSEMADGVVLVIRSGVTDRASAVEAYDQLRADGAIVLGTVLNDWKPSKAQLKKHQYYTTFDSYDRT